MDGVVQLLLLGAGGLVVAALLVAALLVLRRRLRVRGRMRAWAAERGWQYRDRDPGLVAALRGGPFRAGTSRWAEQVLSGSWAGRPARSFRYTYVTYQPEGNTQARMARRRVHVVSLALPGACPRIELTPAGPRARLLTALGRAGLVFGEEEFDRAWHVRAADPAAAAVVLHPRMRQRLLASDMRGRHFLLEGGHLLWWQPGAPDAGAIEPALQRLTDLAALVPGSVSPGSAAPRLADS